MIRLTVLLLLAMLTVMSAATVTMTSLTSEIFHETSEALQETLFDYTRIWNMFFVILLLLTNLPIVLSCIRRKLKIENSILLAVILLLYADYSFFTSGVSFYQGDRFNIVWMPMLMVAICIYFHTLKSKANCS